MYQNVTPVVFERYAKIFQFHYKKPEIIEHTKEQYEKILDGYLHTSNIQIKQDIRNYVLGKCPPMKDMEIKFTGGRKIKSSKNKTRKRYLVKRSQYRIL